MADYGHDLLFGTFLTPTAERADRVLALARLTEQVGLDLVTVQDHPYQARFLDTWTLLSVIAAQTSTVRVAPNVANLPLRPPAVLARGVASLDILSGGRVELGLGAGAFPDAIAAVGGPRYGPAEAVRALEEGIAVRGMWAAGGPPVRLDGRHHRVWGAHPGPAPAHQVGIWVGAYRRRMLALTGKLADGWLPSSAYADPDAVAAMNDVIDEAAVHAGRKPSDIRRPYNITGSFASHGGGFLHGPAEPWAEQLAELTLDHGFSGYILTGDDPDAIRRFASEVAPTVRGLVAAERAGAPVPPAAPVSLGAPATAGDSGAPALGVIPTPDAAHERAAGQHLVDVHDHLREELRRVRQLVEEVTAGTMDPGVARSHLSTMTMRQHDWTLGAYCASYCRVVATHHTLEDRGVFPHLRRGDSRLVPVLDHLVEEHHVIHEVLERVDHALVAFVTDPDGTRDLHAAVDLLTDTLLSHLSYEERELVEPLTRLGFF